MENNILLHQRKYLKIILQLNGYYNLFSVKIPINLNLIFYKKIIKDIFI
jgi:hypothetical protein